MASRVGVLRVPDEDDDDDDVADLFDSEFLEHMEALKQACQMMPGAEVRLKSSTLAASKFDEEEYEDEGDGEVDDDDDDDDDALLLSIERKFWGKGGLVSGPGRSKEKGNPRAGSKDGERQSGVKNGVGTARRFSGGGISGVSQHVSISAADDEDGEDDEDEDLLRSVKESCGALDLVKASKHAKTHSPNVEAAFSEDVQPTSSLEDAGGSSGDGDTVIAVQPICSFLPAQLSDEEFEESSLPLVVHDPSFASGDGEGKVPDSVHAVTEALLKNRLCQQSLREVLRQVELKLHENREMQRRAVSLVEYQKACTRKFCGFTEVANASVELIATKPASKRKAGEFKVKGPPENPDVEVYRQLQSQLPAAFSVKKWTKKETHALVKGVRQQLQEIRVRAMMESWDSDEEGQDFDAQMRSIGESEEDLRKGLPSVDWNEVARIYVSGRSSWECKLQWEHNEDPSLNTKAWTKAEDKKLLSIVQAHDMVEWAAIAEEMGTQRTPAQCAIRFQRSLNASILRSNWTAEEDEQLQAAVEKFGEKDWQSVAACMEGRLGSQCMSRWTKVLHPDRHRRGRWLPEEDTRLKWAVSVYGPRGWKNIAAHVPGRSDVQCRERWCNVLDPSVKIDEWTPEEDAKLENLVVKYGRHRWAAVGAELGRTDNQCFRHWKLLHPEHKISFRKDMVILRAALATNFVGREKERPDLGFQDFLPPSGVGDRSALPPSRPNTSKEKVASKPRKRPSKKRKSPEPSSEVNENLPLEKEAPTPELPSPLLSINGDTAEIYSRKRRAPSRPNKSKEKVAPKPRKMPTKKKSPEPCSDVNENLPIEKEAPTLEVPSTVIESNGDTAEVHSRKRRAPQPGARASKKRKTPELPPVVSENCGDTAMATRGERDAQLIVYTRRKDRFSSSCGKSFLDYTGDLELNAVGTEILVLDKRKE
jgi:hypothetical protein